MFGNQQQQHHGVSSHFNTHQHPLSSTNGGGGGKKIKFPNSTSHLRGGGGGGAMHPHHYPQQQQQQQYNPYQNQQGVEGDFSTSVRESMVKYGAFNWLRIFFLETLATWIFLSLVLLTASTPAPPLALAFVHGLGLFLIFGVFMSEDAGHTNPSVTIVLALLKKLPGPWWSAFIYIFAQMLGAILAVLLTWLLTPDFDRSLGLGSPGLTPGFTSGQGFVAEFFGSAVLYSVIVWVVCLRLYHKKKSKGVITDLPMFLSPNPALVIGFAFTAISIPAIFVTGASFNWFRQFWPALISGTLDGNWWLYLVGPLAGILLTWLLMWGYLKWIGYDTYNNKLSPPVGGNAV